MNYSLDNNQSTNSTPIVYGDNASPLFVLFSIILSIWIIIFNTFVLVCFIQNRKILLKTTFAIQICQLCVCDLYVGFSTMPVYISGFSKGVKFEFCAFSFILFISSQVIVLFHILGICAYRLRVVSRVMTPYSLKAEKKGYLLIYIIINGVICIGIFTVPFLIWGNYRQKVYLCSLPEIFTEAYKSALTYCILFYIVPALLTNAVYIAIIITLCCSNQKAVKQANESSSQDNSAATLTRTDASACENATNLVKSTTKRNTHTESGIASAECDKIYAISFKQKEDTDNAISFKQKQHNDNPVSLKQKQDPDNSIGNQQTSTSAVVKATSSKEHDGQNGDRADESGTADERWTVKFEQVDPEQREKSTKYCFNAQKRAIVLTGIFSLSLTSNAFNSK